MITATQSGYGGMGAEVSKEVVPHPGAAAEARRALEELRAAWFYPDPASPFEDLRDHVAFYPSKMDACWMDGEKVEAQPGDFYEGWITPEIVGPFKGAPGTRGW
jgi:hypothetical protein